MTDPAEPTSPVQPPVIEHHQVLDLIIPAVLKRIETRRPMTALYRLQFRKEFGFADAEKILDYLADLGISHVYSSPQLHAHSGSPHGYDVIDHARLNPELGESRDAERYLETLQRLGMGQILDLVPNHMSVAGDENSWWLDVLQHGLSSQFASFFDIDWNPTKHNLQGKVLLPVLGGMYGQVLEAGELVIEYLNGGFVVRYWETRWPLDPATWPMILSPEESRLIHEFAAETALSFEQTPLLAPPITAEASHPDLVEFQSIVTALKHFPDRRENTPENIAERRRETAVVQGRLNRLVNNSPIVRHHIDRNLASLNGPASDSHEVDALDRLLEAQAFQLVHWRAGSDEMNYRRFFDVNELAAICTEDFPVFAATHRLPLAMAVQGQADGFRIDHIDGLFDPAIYLWRLQFCYLRELGRMEYQRLVDETQIAPTRLEVATPEATLPNDASSSPPVVERVHPCAGGWANLEREFLARMQDYIKGPSLQELFGPGSDLPADPVTSEVGTETYAGHNAAHSEVLPASRPTHQLEKPVLSEDPSHVTNPLATNEARPNPRTDSAACSTTVRDGSRDDITSIQAPDDADAIPESSEGLAVASQVSRYRYLKKHQRGQTSLPLFVVVEKILAADERLPSSWPIQGTSGYEFLNQLNAVFVDVEGLQMLQRHYARFTETRDDFREIAYQSKRVILGGPMQSELQLLAHRLDRISNRHRNSRDFTLQALRTALREIIACFSVYRTYIAQGAISDEDRQIIHRATALARRRNPVLDSAVLEFVRDVLLGEQPPRITADGETERLFFTGRFQQVTSPVMAKGVEDTAFYRYIPLATLEEVGAEPSHPPGGVAVFHQENERRSSEYPSSFLATSTHDTKRSEDVRARLNILSEIPGTWRATVQRWSRWNRKHLREIDGLPAPSRNDEWLFYQMLVGIWPLIPPSESELADLTQRLTLYMEKAIHEAKLRTSWISPNIHYDEAVRSFVQEVLSDGDSRFLKDLRQFHETIVSAGLYNSASQVLLKYMSPGLPDTYQGQEIWDFSLVDPDNRRPVDYELRRHLLNDIQQRSRNSGSCHDLARILARSPDDPRFKLFVTWRALQIRKDYPTLMNGTYLPLEATGSKSVHVCAFARTEYDSPAAHPHLVVVAPRLIHSLSGHDNAKFPWGKCWKDTRITLPSGLTPETHFVDCFTGQSIRTENGELRLETVLADFPMAILVSHHRESNHDIRQLAHASVPPGEEPFEVSEKVTKRLPYASAQTLEEAM